MKVYWNRNADTPIRTHCRTAFKTEETFKLTKCEHRILGCPGYLNTRIFALKHSRKQKETVLILGSCRDTHSVCAVWYNNLH